ncbi:Tab2 family RNA-binding protein [Leptolyngbya sp. PCC 6406]|uniref:Tab2 family RNA-binding protein n=1 Tax=Leptolyngbya sp. PCC 6406 TaxID=1173264 RepID=UPI0002ACBE30|nr:Tab2 family RNA-binding protein [Leptolyngbya sp. PCC 6406]
MTRWEVDFYRRPCEDGQGTPLWELLICDRAFDFTYGAMVSQPEATVDWLQGQLKTAIAKAGIPPDEICAFRPPAVALLQAAAPPLGIAVIPTRQTPTLKQWLVTRSRWYPTLPTYSGAPYDPLAVDRPAPVPVPESLWGEQWRFGALSAADFQEELTQEPIPIQSLPLDWLPLQMGLASTIPIPGVIIDGGRRALALAQWLAAQDPVALNPMVGNPAGLILEAGLCDRWVLTTFEDPQVQAAARTFGERQLQAQGLHFLLVRPDDSGITYTGLWLLRS